MAIDQTDLRGIIVPLVTPLHPEGGIDTRSLEGVVDFVLSAGVHGIFVLGSSGEAPYLTDRERHTVVETVARTAAGRVPVLAGALDMTAARVAQQAQLVRDAGADAAVVAAPAYAIASDAEVVEHFAIVRSAADIPLVAYDIPARVHRRLSPALLAELFERRLILAVKDSSGDIVGMRRTLRYRAPEEGVPVFVGSELAVDVGVLIGCSGAVPGLANVDPHGYVRLYDHATSGRWHEARAEQERLLGLYSAIEIGRGQGMGNDAAAYGAFKAALALRGILPHSATASPQTPVPGPVADRISDLLADAGLI